MASVCDRSNNGGIDEKNSQCGNARLCLFCNMSFWHKDYRPQDAACDDPEFATTRVAG